MLLPAAAFVAGFYLICRSIETMRLMSAHPVGGDGGWSQQITQGLVEMLAYLLPPLDRWTQAAWLIDAAPAASDLATIAAQGMAYFVLLTAAALFDFYRRGF